jgi:hypothetical protein
MEDHTPLVQERIKHAISPQVDNMAYAWQRSGTAIEGNHFNITPKQVKHEGSSDET